MSQRTIIITVDDECGINGRDIGKMIERSTNQRDARLEITATPSTIDIRFEKVYSEITIEGKLYEALKKASKEHRTTPEKILMAGARRYGLTK